MRKEIFLLILFILSFSFLFSENNVQDSLSSIVPKITMIELGSLTCIPCKQMTKVMVSLEERYGEQLEIIFYDVKIEKDKAVEYKVKMIPTQVFLDVEGKEIHRHIGFYPEQQIDEFLESQGVFPLEKPK